MSLPVLSFAMERHVVSVAGGRFANHQLPFKELARENRSSSCAGVRVYVYHRGM